MIVHLMTQNDQPYGSIRKCCEVCGYMPGAYTEDPKAFEEIQLTGKSEGTEYTACTNPFEGK